MKETKDSRAAILRKTVKKGEKGGGKEGEKDRRKKGGREEEKERVSKLGARSALAQASQKQTSTK